MNEASNRTLTLKRTFNAPIAIVWEAWTQPEHIAHWWGPKGMQINVLEHHFRVGGKWKYVMPMPDGSEFTSEGDYLEIEKFKKIISTADFKPMTEGVEIQALFEEDGERPILPLGLFTLQRNTANSRKRWVFIMVGDLLSAGWNRI